MSITSGRPRLRRRETEKQASMPLFVKWAQYAPWRGTPFPAHFQENRPLKTPESLKTWAFPVMVLFLSLLFSKVSTMPCGDCSLSKKLDDGGHKTAELGYPGNIHGCCQSACPSILPAENQGKGNARTPAEPTPCSDHDEAGGGNLPKFPGRFPAVPSKRLSGFHG